MRISLGNWRWTYPRSRISLGSWLRSGGRCQTSIRGWRRKFIIGMDPFIGDGFLFVRGEFYGILAEVSPVRRLFGWFQVFYSCEFVVVNDVELRTYHVSLQIKGYRASVTGGVTEVNTSVRARLPFRCAYGARLVGCVKDVHRETQIWKCVGSLSLMDPVNFSRGLWQLLSSVSRLCLSKMAWTA